MMGARMIRSGRCKRAIVGGVDSLAKFAVNGFNALQILSDKMCKPFDENRNGLNLGEGAAYLVLENEKHCNGKEPYAEVLGYGNTNDAFHPSTLSEDAIGVTQAMEKALQSADLHGTAIDYINTHGTATENNDKVEALGMQKVFGDNLPAYSSTKSYTGHTLAAAGAVEAVFTVLGMQHGEIYPNLNCHHPTSTLEVPPVRSYRQGEEINCAMSNSFGFAGNCTSLIFGKP
jgi:3-oxoacyl-(acyl-carrier-protein) synthase